MLKHLTQSLTEQTRSSIRHMSKDMALKAALVYCGERKFHKLEDNMLFPMIRHFKILVDALAPTKDLPAFYENYRPIYISALLTHNGLMAESNKRDANMRFNVYEI